MKRRKEILGRRGTTGLAVLSIFAGLVAVLATPSQARNKVVMEGKEPAYQVGRYDSHDRFRYNGEGIIHGVGKITIDLDPDAKKGSVVATFKGEDGEWKVVQEKFKMIKTNVYLHGATGGDVDASMSPPVLPKIWTYVATWGPAVVWHNGKLAWKGVGHLMVTEEVRDPVTGKVDFKGPMKVKEYPGSVYNPSGIQVHFVAHPKEEPTKGYLPPYTKFLHLMYDTVEWK